MKIGELRRSLDWARAGDEMYALVAELYPICRSITGDGLRATLRRLGRDLDLECHEVPSGTVAFDWTVPREWNIRDAWVKNARGERVIDFRRSNLHVLHYSTPVRCTVGLDELKRHLHSLPERPQWIPYRTSYYEEGWGFCVEHERLAGFGEGSYEVCIDARLEDGSLSYGECAMGGASDEEFLLSCHTCHPSLCNDNLSGVVLTAHLARLLAGLELRYSYRCLFIPGTIGAITWLSRNRQRTARIHHGLVVACVGDGGPFHYKSSRRYRNTNPHCEPQLGRRGLYRAIGGSASPGRTEMALLWVLNLSDGATDLLAIADRAQLDFDTVRHAADLLCSHGLLAETA